MARLVAFVAEPTLPRVGTEPEMCGITAVWCGRQPGAVQGRPLSQWPQRHARVTSDGDKPAGLLFDRGSMERRSSEGPSQFLCTGTDGRPHSRDKRGRRVQ